MTTCLKIYRVRIKHASSTALAADVENPWNYHWISVVADDEDQAKRLVICAYRDKHYSNDPDAEVISSAIEFNRSIDRMTEGDMQLRWDTHLTVTLG